MLDETMDDRLQALTDLICQVPPVPLVVDGVTETILTEYDGRFLALISKRHRAVSRIIDI
jgi:hypothetical protein